MSDLERDLATLSSNGASWYYFLVPLDPLLALILVAEAFFLAYFAFIKLQM